MFATTRLICRRRLSGFLLFIALCFAILCTGASLPVHAGEIKFSDSFKSGENDRLVDNSLNGVATEKGDGTWIAAPHLVFGGENADFWVTTALKANRAGSAQVAIPAGALDFRRVEINMDVKVMAEKEGWIAIGFGPSGNFVDCNWKGGLFLLLNHKGGSELWVNGVKSKLVSKRITDFHEGALNRLHLSYDRQNNTVSARVNEVEMANDLPVKDFTPDVKFGGFSNFGTNGESQIKDFAMTIEGDKVSEAPAPAAQSTADAKAGADPYRILFIGDSITQSAPNSTPGWTITSGMAASSPDKDYVTLVSNAAGTSLGRKVNRKVVADKGGKVASYSGRAQLYQAFAPHLAVVQFGENERGTTADFERDFRALLREVSEISPKPTIICTGIWLPYSPWPYTGRTGEMEKVVQKLAAEFGAGYAPVGKYASDKKCTGYGSSDGIRWHPNDAGMQGYAESILAQWEKMRKAAK